jgi:hypothetical protein
MGGLIRFCHDRRDFIGAIYIMPLVQNWDAEKWDYQPEQMTAEDVEVAVAEAFPDDNVEFLPAGFTVRLPNLRRCLRIKPLPFQGAHPACESIFLMISDGEEYVPFTRHLKGSAPEAAQALVDADEALGRRVEALDRGVFGRLLSALGLKDGVLYLKGALTTVSVLRRHVRLSRYIKGKGLGKLYHGLALPLALAFGRRSREALQRHTTIHAILEILMLPFEDAYTIESHRMERCPTAFAFVDPDDDRVKTVPACAWWTIHKAEVLPKIAKLGANKAASVASPPSQ